MRQPCSGLKEPASVSVKTPDTVVPASPTTSNQTNKKCCYTEALLLFRMRKQKLRAIGDTAKFIQLVKFTQSSSMALVNR